MSLEPFTPPRSPIDLIIIKPSTQDTVIVQYTNHRGETKIRHIRPIRIYFGSTAWHPEPQWIMEVWDMDKQGTREYSLEGVMGPFRKVTV